MITDQSKDLRAKRAAIIEEMRDLTKDDGSWNSNANGKEAKQRWAELDTQQKQLAEQVRAIEQTEGPYKEMREVKAPPQGQPGGENRAPASSFEEATKRVQEKLDSKEYKEAFMDWARRGDKRCNRSNLEILEGTNNEARTYSGLSTSTSGDAGGYTVPIGFQRELEIKMKAYGRMRDNCRIINTSTGNTLDWPTMDDTSNSGEIVGEALPVSQVNPTFGQIQFSSSLFSSKQVLISVQLMQDSAFDLEGELRDAFAIRLGRKLNDSYTNGTGSSQPQGLVYAIKNDSVPNIVNATGANSNSGASGDTEANSIGSDDLDSLISAVDPAYRPNGRFMFHWKTIDALRKVKDKYGRPLWVASLAVGEPDRIFGYPYDWNADMDAVGAGKYSALFGDFQKHAIRDVGGVTVVRYNELYMPNHQIGFQAFLRSDSRRLQQAAFSLLYNPLS